METQAQAQTQAQAVQDQAQAQAAQAQLSTTEFALRPKSEGIKKANDEQEKKADVQKPAPERRGLGRFRPRRVRRRELAMRRISRGEVANDVQEYKANFQLPPELREFDRFGPRRISRGEVAMSEGEKQLAIKNQEEIDAGTYYKWERIDKRVVITSQEWGNRRRALQLKLHRPSKEELKKMPLFGE